MKDFWLCVAGICALIIGCCGMTVRTPLDDWHALDPTNLRTLNRESRKSLLDIITRELGLVRRTLDALRPQLSECQNKTMNVMGQCIDCVDNMCQDSRRRECKGRANVVVPSGGGVSVSGQRDSQGRHVVTVCALIRDNSQSCQTIMNPDGVMVSSIENMGDNLMVHLRGAVNDMGGNSVGTFVNGMQTFIGNYRPLRGDISNINETELNTMLNSMNEQYNQITRQVNDQMFDMGQQMNQGMNMFSNSFGQDMQQFSNNMNRQMNNLMQSMTNMFQQPTMPTNMFMQPQQPNMFMQPQQQRNMLPHFGHMMTMPVQPTTPSEVFSRQFNEFFRQTTSRNSMFRIPQTTSRNNMFRAPPTTKRIPETTPITTTTPTTTTVAATTTTSPVTTQTPEVPSGSGPLRPNTGVIPSVVNIDSIIGRSDTGNFPGVLNINSQIGVQDTFQDTMNPIRPTPPSVFRPDPNMNINSPPGRLPSSRSSNILNMNSDISNMNSNILNQDTVGSLGTSLSGMNIPDVLNLNSPVLNQINKPGMPGSHSPGDPPSVVNINSRIGNLGILGDTGIKKELTTTQNVPSVLNINSRIDNQNSPRINLNQNDPALLQNPWMTGMMGNNNFANDMNKFASDLQRSLSNLFGGGMFGRKKRSIKQRRRNVEPKPGGVPIDFSPKPTSFTPTKTPLNKETYVRANRWNSFLKSLGTDSIPVGGNPEDGVSIRARKSVRANLSIEPYMSETKSHSFSSRKSKRKTFKGPNTAGGLLVYSDPTANSPTANPGRGRAAFDKRRQTKSVETATAATAKTSTMTTTTTVMPIQIIDSSPPPELSRYPTSPLKLELQRIIKALTMKSAERTISAYPFDPTARTTQLPPTTAPTTYVTSSARNVVETSTISTLKPPSVTTPAAKSFLAPFKVASTTEATRLLFTAAPPPVRQQNIESMPPASRNNLLQAIPHAVSSNVIDRPVLSTQAPPLPATVNTDIAGQTPPPPNFEYQRVDTRKPILIEGPMAPTTNEKDCGLIYLNSTSCLQYTQMCSACADYIDSRKGDILKSVCGGALVEEMITLKSKLTALQGIYDQVITSTDILNKVEFDRTSGDMISLAFTRVKATASIGGKPVNFMASYPLRLLDLPMSARNLAEQIWRLWNDGNTFR